MIHTHTIAGQNLTHTHPGGGEPHGYYEHPEDSDGSHVGPAGVLMREDRPEDRIEATRNLAALLVRLTHGDLDGSVTYDSKTAVGTTWRAYMVAGGGPTEWLYFLLDHGYLVLGFLHHISGGDPPVMVPIPEPLLMDAYRACVADTAARVAR